MGQVAIGVRLASYGLREADTPLEDLKVTAQAEHVLSSKNPAVAKRMHVLHPSSLDQLKKWVGLPSGAAAVTHAGPIGTHAVVPRNRVTDIHALVDLRKPLPAKLTRDHTTALYSAAHQYVLTHDHGLEAATISNVDKWLVALKPSIIFWMYHDIHVAAGAKLTLSTSNSVLFARYIEVEKTGKLQIKAAIAKIDCAGFKGH